MTWEVCRQFLDLVLAMIARYPSSSNMTLAMNCAYHCLAFIWSERSIGNESDTECETRVSLVIQYVLDWPTSGENEEVCLSEVRNLKEKLLLNS